MRVTFVSNYMNHHQQPFSEAMRARLGEDYTFIQTQPMEKERVQMGWDTSAQSLSFVRKFWEQEETCRQLIMDSDVVIFGWTGMEELIVPRPAGRRTDLPELRADLQGRAMESHFTPWIKAKIPGLHSIS